MSRVAAAPPDLGLGVRTGRIQEDNGSAEAVELARALAGSTSDETGPPKRRMVR
jgi:hypothetical protein